MTTKKNELKKIYDIHCHTMTLAHAGLLSFVNRTFLDNGISLYDIQNANFFLLIFKLLKYKFLSTFRKGKTSSSPGFKKVGIILGLTVLSYIICYGIICYFYKNSIILTTLVYFAVLTIASIFLAIYFIIKSRLIISQTINKIFNLISFMENDIGSMFQYMEIDALLLDQTIRENSQNYYEIKNNELINVQYKELIKQSKSLWDKNQKQIVTDNITFNKMILTPLIMDFQPNDFSGIKDVHYSSPPQKPVTLQVMDLFAGIYKYYNESEVQLFEIYPFMGIDPKHYIQGVIIPFTDSTTTSLLKNKLMYDNKMITSYPIYYGIKTNSIYMSRPFTGKELEEFLKIIKNKNDKKILRDLQQEFLTGTFKNYNSVPRMLYKYFSNYNKNNTYSTYAKSYNKHYKNKSNVSDIEKLGNFYFSGIKVYPPLGFIPWPENNYDSFKIEIDISNYDNNTIKQIKKNLSHENYSDKKIITLIEQEKAEYLYTFAEEKGIPLTTHSATGGFHVSKYYKKVTDPDCFIPVLEKYSQLKINFAHIGGEVTFGELQKKIFKLMFTYDHVYTDFSYDCFTDKDYTTLMNTLEKAQTMAENKDNISLYDKVLFGTDFMINLLRTSSYYHYLNTFFNYKPTDAENEKHLNTQLKNKFISENPESFIFGKIK